MRHPLPVKYLLPLFCLPLLLFSCKKDLEEIEIAPEITWEAHKQFMHNERYISSLHAEADNLNVLGMYLFSTISHAGAETDVQHYMHSFRNLSHYKNPMSSKVFMGMEGSVLYFKSIKNPTSMGSDLTLDMTKVDPHFRGLRLLLSLTMESMAITEQNVALIPYTAYDEEQKKYLGLRYLLVRLSVEEGFYEKITLEDSQILISESDGGSIRYMGSHDDNFFVSNDKGFFQISEEGKITHITADQIGHATFRYKGNLYAVTWNGPRRSTSLYRFETSNTWTHNQELAAEAQMLTYYALSDDLLLASFKSQLYEVEIGANQFILKELDNAGLEGHFITDIAKVKDQVYIGTQSGLFSKDVAHLLTYKEEAK